MPTIQLLCERDEARAQLAACRAEVAVLKDELHRTRGLCAAVCRDVLAYLGRSLVAVDPYFDGALDEFRIHDHAFNLADDQASSAHRPTRLVRLIVNAVTGELSIVTDSASPIA